MKKLQLRVLPDVRILVPVVLAAHAAVNDDQSRRVSGLRFGNQPEHVLVQRSDGNIVLERGVPVEEHRRVDGEGGSPLGSYHQSKLPGSFDDLLPSVAARLIVAL